MRLAVTRTVTFLAVLLAAHRALAQRQSSGAKADVARGPAQQPRQQAHEPAGAGRPVRAPSGYWGVTAAAPARAMRPMALREPELGGVDRLDGGGVNAFREPLGVLTEPLAVLVEPLTAADPADALPNGAVAQSLDQPIVRFGRRPEAAPARARVEQAHPRITWR